MKHYTVEEIAESLGVNVASVHRWADSEKLICSGIEDGIKKFSTGNLAEFAAKYNISMRFLDSGNNQLSNRLKRLSTISAAK